MTIPAPAPSQPPRWWSWLTDRLDEPSTWNAIGIALGGIATYLGTHGYSHVAVWPAAVAAGISAVVGFAKSEK